MCKRSSVLVWLEGLHLSGVARTVWLRLSVAIALSTVTPLSYNLGVRMPAKVKSIVQT